MAAAANESRIINVRAKEDDENKVINYFCEDRFAIMCDHERLFAIKNYRGVLKRLLAKLKNVVEVGNSTFKHASEISRN